LLAVTATVLALSLGLTGCGGSKDSGGGTGTSTTSGKAETDKGSGKGEMTAIEPGKATLKGKVTLAGNPPDLTKMTEALQAEMKAKDPTNCLSGNPRDVAEQKWRIGKNNQVGNVFVWLAPPDRSHYFKLSEEQLKAGKEPVAIDQPHCAFVPHCLVLFPSSRDPKNPRKLTETGQKFVVKNSAKITHNTKMEGGAKNSGFNVTIEAGKEATPTVEPSNDPVQVSCGIHPWMSGWVWVFDHPYATLTRAQDPKTNEFIDEGDASYGTYELKGLPTGKVRVVAWHEEAGFLGGEGSKGVEIELKEGDNTKDFELKPK